MGNESIKSKLKIKSLWNQVPKIKKEEIRLVFWVQLKNCTIEQIPALKRPSACSSRRGNWRV